MIYHYNRVSFKPNISQAERDAALGSWHEQGRVIGSVEWFSIGQDVSDDFEYVAVFVVRDIAGYHEYMSNPTHRHTDEIGLPLIDKFVSYDLIDDPDPTVDDQIREVHAERFAGDAGLVDLIQGLGSYTGASNPKEGSPETDH